MRIPRGGASRAAALTFALTVALAAGPASSQEAEEPLYTLIDLGAYAAVAVNDAGQVAANSVAGPPRSFRISVDAAGGVTVADVTGIPGGSGLVWAHAISATGSVFGKSSAGYALQYCDSPAPTVEYFRAFRAPVGGAAADLGRLLLNTNPFADQCGGAPNEQYNVSEAWGVNAQGVAVGQSHTAYESFPQVAQKRAVKFDGGVQQLSQDESIALGVNSAGTVVGWVRGFVTQRAALWSDGVQYDIDAPGSFSATALDINVQDQVVGSREVAVPPNPPYSRAILIQLDGTSVASDTDLGVLPGGRTSQALSINDAGVIVGWSEASTLGQTRAVAWTLGEMRDLNDLVDPESPGLPAAGTWVLERAVSVSESGDIACTGRRDGAARSFLLRSPVGRLAADPAALDFGDVPTGEMVERTLILRNGSDDAVKLKPVKPPKPFQLVAPKQIALAAGESRAVTVRVAPVDAGEVAGTLTFVGAEEPLAVPLRVVGIPPISLSPDPLAFGVGRGFPVRTMTVTNLRDKPVRVRLYGLKRPFTLKSPSSITIPALASATVEIEFTALPPKGDHAGRLVAKANVPGTRAVEAAVTGATTEDPVVLRIAGIAAVQRGDAEPVEVVEGQELRGEDQLSTGPDSSIEFLCPDGHVVTLHELASLRIGELKDAGNRIKIEMLLRSGALEAHREPRKVANTDFSVSTPEAVAGVRGTRFEVIRDEAGETTVVRVHEGLVHVESPSGSRRNVRAGKQTTVRLGVVAPPVALEP